MTPEQLHEMRVDLPTRLRALSASPRTVRLADAVLLDMAADVIDLARRILLDSSLCPYCGAKAFVHADLTWACDESCS